MAFYFSSTTSKLFYCGRSCRVSLINYLLRRKHSVHRLLGVATKLLCVSLKIITMRSLLLSRSNRILRMLHEQVSEIRVVLISTLLVLSIHIWALLVSYTTCSVKVLISLILVIQISIRLWLLLLICVVKVQFKRRICLNTDFLYRLVHRRG